MAKTRVIPLDPHTETQQVEIARGLANLGYGRYNAGDTTIDVFGLDPVYEADEEDEDWTATTLRTFHVLPSDVDIPEEAGVYWGSARLDDGTYRHVWSLNEGY